MPTPGEKRKILCVDDDLVLAELCEERLKELGYEVVGVADPEKALQLLEESPDGFDLLIVDQVMPNVTGTELAKKALLIRPDVNVLLVTGHEGAVSKEEAREAGVKEVLAKPLTRAELEAAIKRALG
ncbi:MAG: response regulator [Syntrophorhabdales bacterium]